jgi:TetR/AcrR family transcriptional repressor of nem operon
MPRPKEFDEAAALDAAIECFWRRGYEATSLRDLTSSMGLSAPSLYNAFGDKHALFGLALDRYLERGTRDRLHRLEATLPPRDALRRFFDEIIDLSVKDRQRKGCFLVNSALDVAPHDADCRALIAGQFSEIEAFFSRCLHAAGADGAAPFVDTADAARLLLAALLGIRVLARTGATRAMLEGVARPALMLLDQPPRPRKRRR